MAIAIEPMLNLGCDDVVVNEEDGWTVSADQQLFVLALFDKVFGGILCHSFLLIQLKTGSEPESFQFSAG